MNSQTNSKDNAQESGRLGLNFALPAVEFTDRHVQGILEHDLSYSAIALLLYYLGNCDADKNKGFIHRHKIAYLAKVIGCKPQYFYGKNGLIAQLNATGMIQLKIKNLKVSGKIVEPPKKRAEDRVSKHPYKLCISMIHRECLMALLPKTRSKAILLTMLILTMHCDLNSGELNTEFRASEIADMIDMDRTSVERAIDWLHENGFTEVTRDYVIEGRLPYTAMARGFLKMSAVRAKEEKAKAKEARKAGRDDYTWIETKLVKFFGINARGFMKSQLKEAFEYFIKPFLPKPKQTQGVPKSTGMQRPTDTQPFGSHLHSMFTSS